MKYLLLIILFLLGFYSCESNSPGDCNGDKCIPPCYADNDCIKSKRYGEGYYCDKTGSHKEGVCQINACKKLNINCGKGVCVPHFGNAYYCKCDEGYIYKYSEEEKISTCLENYCEKSKECSGLVIFNENGHPDIKSLFCSSEHKCTASCDADNDCIENNEYCYKETKRDYCISIEDELNSCEDGKYYDIYSRDDNKQKPKCMNLCNTNMDCYPYNTDFVCDTQRHCVPPCQTNQDCINDKFSYGNICDTENNSCVKELTQTIDSESKATNSIIKEFAIDNCEAPEEQFFDKTCGDYNINSKKGHEFQHFITIISIKNENYDYQHRSANVNSKSERDNLIEMAKAKTKSFLNTNFKDYDFKLYKAEVYNGYHEWTETNKLVNQVRLDYSRVWGGIPVLGANALFTLNLSMEYIYMEIAFLPLEPKIKDQTLIDELNIQNEQIKQYLIQYNSEDETNSKYAYFIFETGPELVFLLQVDNAFHLLIKSDYDGTYESVENAVSPHSEDPCTPNPCTIEAHQTICHSVNEGSDYYCTCEAGYISNANGQTPACIEE